MATTVYAGQGAAARFEVTSIRAIRPRQQILMGGLRSKTERVRWPATLRCGAGHARVGAPLHRPGSG